VTSTKIIYTLTKMSRCLFKRTSKCVSRLSHQRNLSTVDSDIRVDSADDKNKLIFSTSHDYIVVGSGSAGCVLANRLSENERDQVLAIEAGPKDAWWNWKIHMPAALTYNLCNDNYNWYYNTEEQKNMNNRKMYWPRGRVWGGSSALNAMVYIRGHAYDYDRWEDEGGAKGWSYADCLPYFKKSQTHPLGEDDYRGGDGPLKISRGRMINPLYNAFIEAGEQAGYPYTPDCNGFQQEGVGPYDMTIHNGKRWSASQAYLRPALKRKNLDTRTGAVVTRIIVENSKAIGVEYIQDSQLKRAKANKEVILAGGAINSPHLLMLSGIGDATELRQHNIPCINNLPGVGKNLQDHLEVYIQSNCTQPITLYKQTRLWYMPIIGSQWFLTRTGDCGTNSLEAGGFIRTRESLPSPDIQLHFLPFAVKDHGRQFPDGHAYQLHAGTLRATSRGTVTLKSNNPFDHPLMDPNYLSTEQDILDMRACVKLSREIMQQDAFIPFRGDELQPGISVKTDKEIDAFVREKGDSAYHPSCTCKMGDENDPMSVVDSDTRVKGVEGLRIVDASIMPYVVSGNLNGPVIMMAEKAADIIKGKKLPKSNAPVYKTPLTGQR